MNTTPTIGHNGGPSLSTTEKIEELVEATFDAALKRVKSDEVNGADLNAATKILEKVGALQAIANKHEEKAQELRQKRILSNQLIDGLPDFDEDGNILSLPNHHQAIR